jgi:hypothetical protein
MEPLSWKAKSALVALAALFVLGTLGLVVNSNRDRADGWHRRAVAAEESVGGLRVVIAERSRALNRRTLQANHLANQRDSMRAVLRRSKANVGTLTRRQSELANANTRLARERRALLARHAALERIASRLRACAPSAPRSTKRVTVASRAASCKRAAASLDAYLERTG